MSEKFDLINQLKSDMDTFSSKLSKLGKTHEYSHPQEFDTNSSKYNLNKYLHDKSRAINEGEYGYFDKRNNPSSRKRRNRRAASVTNIQKHTADNGQSRQNIVPFLNSSHKPRR